MATVSEIIKKAGGVTCIAKKMSRPVQTVSAWGQRGRIPAGRAIEFEAVTGVSRHVLRPDVFGPPSSGSSSERAP